MKSILEYLSINVKPSMIHSTDDTIKQIVKDELDRLGHDADLNHIDVNKVINMDSLFSCSFNNSLGPTKYKDLNPDISRWNVSNVKNMSHMFYECKNFNCDLYRWNVSKVENMCSMFYNCKIFDQDISKWVVSKVETMGRMFYECIKFNQDLSQWDVSNVEDMRYMFHGCENFNQDLSRWNVDKVENMYSIFDNCPIKKEWKPNFN